MNDLKTIGGVVLFILATISFINVSEGHSGAGLWGMITFYAIMIVISGTLIFFGTRKPKEERIKDKEQKIINTENENYNSKIESLTELKNKEILTEEEYNEKIKNLENLKSEAQLKLSDDYKKLKSLFDDGILTEQEFKSKIEILRETLNKEEKKPVEEIIDSIITEEELVHSWYDINNETYYHFKENNKLFIIPISSIFREESEWSIGEDKKHIKTKSKKNKIIFYVKENLSKKTKFLTNNELIMLMKP